MEKKDQLVCVCNEIYRSTIEDAIVNEGCRTLEDIQSKTSAGTVCGGCIDEIEYILKETIRDKNL